MHTAFRTQIFATVVTDGLKIKVSFKTNTSKWINNKIFANSPANKKGSYVQVTKLNLRVHLSVSTSNTVL